MTKSLLACMFGFTVCGALPSYGQAPLSVCDLIVRRTELDGRMVTVRGIVGGGGHGTFLRAQRSCAYELITRGVAWPNVVALTYPDNRSKIPADHANFKVDWGAIRRADNEAVRGGYDPKTNHEVATFIGLSITFSDLENRVTPGMPGALRLGFGPDLLGAPTQLLIKSINDVVIVKNGEDEKEQ